MLDSLSVRRYRRNVARRLTRSLGEGIEMTDLRTILGTAAGLLAEQRANATALAERIRAAQKARGLALDTRADYAEGSAAAYATALSILAGAAGVPDPLQLIETGAGEPSDQPELGPVGPSIEPRVIAGLLVSPISPDAEPFTDDPDSGFPVDHEYAGG